MKALIIATLQQFVAPSRGTSAPFKLRDESFRGRGLLPGVREGDWRTTVEQIYEGRGGNGGGR